MSEAKQQSATKWHIAPVNAMWIEAWFLGHRRGGGPTHEQSCWENNKT